jgi:hypothetical protein
MNASNGHERQRLQSRAALWRIVSALSPYHLLIRPPVAEEELASIR